MTKSVQIETGIADVAYLKTNRYSYVSPRR